MCCRYFKLRCGMSAALEQPITIQPLPGAVISPAGPISWWRQALVPSFSDCFFVAILVWLFVAGPSGWKSLLMDGDTGWHIRTGEYILDHARVPHNDLYSFTKPGGVWFAWEWLSDVIFGCLFRIGGLRALVFFCGVLIAAYAAVLLRYALWRGSNVMLALPVVLLAIGSSTIHFLARPHLFTLLLLPTALWIFERDRRGPGQAIWLLIPLTAVWANLHGGFAIFLALLGCAIMGLAAESLTGRPRWAEVKRYAQLLAGCVLATLANPFGAKLHEHIFEYLRADWIRNLVQEFQAPTFRSEGQLQFEILLILGLMLCTRLIAQRRLADAFMILFLAHSALSSVRHAPLFALLVAPLLASELTSLWRSRVDVSSPGASSRILFQIGADISPAFQRGTVWVGVALAGVALSPYAWPADFPGEAFPVGMVHRNENLLVGKRILTSDQWGDYMIYALYPKKHKVFIDGRSDFYGERLGRDYLSLMQGDSKSVGLLDRYAFNAVLVPVDWPISAILKAKRTWRVVEDDGRSILFATKENVPRPTAPQA